MKNSMLMTVIAGLLFGVWPLLMNQSKLSGMSSAAAFVSFATLIVVPVAAYSGITLTEAKWWLGIAAGIVAGIAILIFNRTISITPSAQMGPMFIVLLMAQLFPAVIYDGVTNGTLPMTKVVGIACGIAAAVLVNL